MVGLTRSSLSNHTNEDSVISGQDRLPGPQAKIKRIITRSNGVKWMSNLLLSGDDFALCKAPAKSLFWTALVRDKMARSVREDIKP